MDKVAYYKDYIYKEAGLAGGLLGGTLVGGALGHYLGKGSAAIACRRSPEIKNMHNEQKKLQKYINAHQDEINKYEPNTIFDTMPNVSKIPSEKLNNMTIGELKEFLNEQHNLEYSKLRKAYNINKTASFGDHVPLKASTIGGALLAGIPSAYLTAKSNYKDAIRDRTNVQYNKERVNKLRDKKEKMEKYLSGDKKTPYRNFEEAYKSDIDTDFSPFVAQLGHSGLINNGQDNCYVDIYGAAQAGATIDKKLKAKGVNIDKMKYKDYLNAVRHYTNKNEGR